MDAMPTLLDLCGIVIPDSVQGTSLVSLLNREIESVQDAIYYETLKGPEKTPIPEERRRTHDWVYLRTEAGHKGCLI